MENDIVIKTAEKLLMSPRELFYKAASEERQLSVDVDAVWRNWYHIGVIPDWLSDFCKKTLAEDKHTRPLFPVDNEDGD